LNGKLLLQQFSSYHFNPPTWPPWRQLQRKHWGYRRCARPSRFRQISC